LGRDEALSGTQIHTAPHINGPYWSRGLPTSKHEATINWIADDISKNETTPHLFASFPDGTVLSRAWPDTFSYPLRSFYLENGQWLALIRKNPQYKNERFVDLSLPTRNYL